jgi:hypothetical protein
MSDTIKPRSLPPGIFESFDRQVSLYSLAAAAAGVSVLALAPPAEGKVVVTTKTIHLAFNQQVSLDLNHDGITDVQFDLRYFPEGCGAAGSLTVTVPAGNGVIGGTAYRGYVSALVRGARIGPDKFIPSAGHAIVEFSNIEYCSGSAARSSVGKWGGNPPNRYVGVKFLIHGTTHYGWIRMSVDFRPIRGKLPSATITAYGYETVADKPIKAGSAPTAVASASFEVMKSGQPSLGMLALGADGLAIWRRKETLSTI